MRMNFDEEINRIGTRSNKWDEMERFYGVSPTEGLPMWVADMDFRPPASVQRALEKHVGEGVFGYFGGDGGAYKAAVQWWMKTRHGWEVEADSIFTTYGLVNGVAVCIDTFTKPGDGVVLMTPVYHAFARVIKAAERVVVECPLALHDNRYVMDFDAWEAQMTGNERMLVLCSPHNPGGQVWTVQELQAVAAFCLRHDLILVSDEIHHDLVYPGHKHTVAPLAMPEILDRLIMMTACSKTFNLAGPHSGNVIISDPALRARFAARLSALGISSSSFGLIVATAAYSPEGAEWLDALLPYLEGNRDLLMEGLSAIPGVKPMPMEATYLCWVDFSGTGMSAQEVQARVEKDAKIAANHGASFGKGGETYLRFNIATPRARIIEAVARLQKAFGDLQ
jgi:cysteine-S-conjugate beta-lyase